ncbi:MAG: DASH family cryptochrome, partial [Acidiferrobacterales bacterium]|nr:DASH family cryptochrome [Acidiferrobacterales bacterium]
KRFFEQQSLHVLNEQLREIGQYLWVLGGGAKDKLMEVINMINPTDVIRSQSAGWFENHVWVSLQVRHPDLTFHSVDTHTLFELEDLPFLLADLPTSFTKFKNAVKDCKPRQPTEAILSLPLPGTHRITLQEPIHWPAENSPFHGGEACGLQHLKAYFSSSKPGEYKQVRNAIDGWDNSCKFSPWLANGCLSVRETASALFRYEEEVERNESTYWIYFELLWREYFQWYAHKFGNKLFLLSGIKGVRPVDDCDPAKILAWVQGETAYPIVNACMNELRVTGYLSNRGRQIVASCFVNELSLDWRYGAAYFERVLIDYDVASNWGNWQYLAGVGADSREKRHFNLEKQAQLFDPDSRYSNYWNGEGKNL